MNEQTPESWGTRLFRRFMGAVVVVTGIVRVATRDVSVLTVTLVGLGCVAVAMAVWQEARSFVRARRRSVR
ncbi:hypothetical protein ACIQU5_31775 [Streptomyces sp. NPDC090306]|uniref:hypothetical protein n=1 Tax=Streptomyces sp. NPDC090306 TaxID=3365961 RepID=UPI003808D1EC